MFVRLFLLFLFLPALEIYILLRVGNVLGAGATVVLVVLTAAVGAWLARQSGLHSLLRIRASLDQGIMPAEEIFDAFFILIAGFLLLVPGFLTDFIGLLLLFPPSRMLFRTFVQRRMEARKQSHVQVIHFTDRDL